MEETGGINFVINGVAHFVKDGTLPSSYMLSSYVRNEALLTGTKTMCKQGVCGICTVTVTVNDLDTPISVNSCLVPISICNGWNITTVEGLGNERDGYHPIQKILADNNGSQCGFCSPGMVMTMFGSTLESEKSANTFPEISLDGCMCRCTGYGPIITSLQKCADIEDVAKCAGCPQRGSQKCALVPDVINKTSDSTIWYHPSSLSSLRNLLSQHENDDYAIVAGGTSTGIYQSKDGKKKIYVDINGVAELLTSVNEANGSVRIGSRVTLSRLIKQFEELSAQESYKYLKQAATYLTQVANAQIRNMATWAGNLMVKHRHPDFVSDLFVLLESIEATLDIFDCSSQICLQSSIKHFLDLDMSGKYIEALIISPKPDHQLITYKSMPTSANSLAFLNFALLISIDSYGTVTTRPNLVFGGISKHINHADGVEAVLTGSQLDEKTLQECYIIIDSYEFDDDPLVPSTNCRKVLAKNLLLKAVLTLRSKDGSCVDGAVLTRPPWKKGERIFQTFPEDYPLRLPTPKLDSIKQTAGESQFIDDMPPMAGQLYAVFVTSTIGSGEIKSIDTSAAEKMPGVHRILTFGDIPGKNALYEREGLVEPLLCQSQVSYYGQPLAIVLAESYSQAYDARTKVIVEYQNLKKPILTIKDAIEAESYFETGNFFNVSQGDPQGAMDKCDVIIEGDVELGEQYPMHMETQTSSSCYQDGHFIIYSATQAVVEVRDAISSILGVHANQIDIQVGRVGGGFGAKSSRTAYLAAAATLGTYITRRPVKMGLSLEDNMAILGRRHPFRMSYKLGASKDMKIQGLVATVYENCGFVLVDDCGYQALRWLDSAYYVPNCDVKLVRVKSNQPSHTYLRAAGSADSIHLMEQVMEHLAFTFQVPGEVVREANLYKDGHMTPYGDIVSPCYLEELINQLKQSCHFEQRSSEIEMFNSQTKWRKKAIAMMPLKYGVRYFPGFEHLVHVMVNGNDGSVTVIHGGIEVGQGINTKVIQTAAKTLNIPMDMIKVKPSSSVINVNNNVTAGSVTSDMNCLAVMRACEDLLKRLEPFREKATDWLSLIQLSRMSCVDLHAKHHITFKDYEPKNWWLYNVFGAACAEVELDCLTGNYVIQKMDILYDAGFSYSPSIDMGQIEGALTMGLGLYLLEEIKYDLSTGKNITTDIWRYHAPKAADIPVVLNVELLSNRPNNEVPLRSKVVGEPPLLLAQSVLIALRKAVTEVRKSRGLNEFFSIDAPFTKEKIIMACME